jgi:predicted molibdopterin-dependent oxidoreductase YjgC
VPGLGTSFGRGGATTTQQDLVNADAILIIGSSMAEAHPVGFRWVIKARDENWEEKDEKHHPVKRTLALAHLGGATLDNEENYLLKKLYTALGVVQVENQARI